MEQLTDAELVDQALAGDREAFACLVARYQDYAYGTAVGVLSDFELSRDVVQEAFLHAYRDLQKLREPARFAGWLRGIVRHTAFRAMRELKSVRALAEQFSRSREQPTPTPRPDHAAEKAEDRQIVRQALSRLSATNREAVSLHYVDGLSYADIAGFLGVTVTAVQGRLQRGRKELKKVLTMVAETFKQNAPDESFAAKVTQAVKVYTSKGPDSSHMGSQWDRRLRAKTKELLGSGRDGFDVAVELSRSPKAKARCAAAVYFGLACNEHGAEHLLRLVQDSNAKVRIRALRAYAYLIHPKRKGFSRWAIAEDAESVPSGAQTVAALLADVNTKIRWYAVITLGAYAGHGDNLIDKALRGALADPKHKIVHEAARTLSIDCPGCGAAPSSPPVQ